MGGATVTIRPGARNTGAHHHGELESVIYVVRGRAAMRSGERLECTTEVGPGGFAIIRPTCGIRRSTPFIARR